MTTEKRQLKEQIATHVYRRPALSPAPHPAYGGRMPHEAGIREMRQASNNRTRQRVVTKPDSVQPAAAERYINRRNSIYSARTKGPAYPPVAPRTLAVTGERASVGQMREIRRSLPQYYPSPVPRRSGLRQGRRKGFLWKVLGIFAGLLIAVLGANFALTGTAFRVAQVSVAGTHNPLLVQAIQHMGMQGQNIFLIDAAALTSRIDLLPLVASANLEKQWPNSLQVIVSERRPVLLWQTRYGTYSVDRNGVVIAPASQTAGAETLITVVDMRHNGKGSKGTVGQTLHPGVQLNVADIAFAQAVFARLPKVVGSMDFTLRYLDAPFARGQSDLEDGSYVVESRTGWLAYLGGAGDANPLDNRLLELQQILLLAQQQQLNLATVDLRFGLRPIYTLKS